MANILELSEKAVLFIGFQSDRKQEKTARNQRKYNTKYNVQAVKLSNEIGSSKAVVETIPIFAMTANTFVAVKKRCRYAGMSGYIASRSMLRRLQRRLRTTPDAAISDYSPALRFVIEQVGHI